MTYWEALDKARTLARAGEGSSDALITVKEAVDNYETDLAGRGAEKGNATAIRRNLPDTMAAAWYSCSPKRSYDMAQWQVKRGFQPASADRVARCSRPRCIWPLPMIRASPTSQHGAMA